MPVYIYLEITEKRVSVKTANADNQEAADQMMRSTTAGKFECVSVAPANIGGLGGISIPNRPTENKVGCQEI
jgi:hypothetical protein